MWNQMWNHQMWKNEPQKNYQEVNQEHEGLINFLMDVAQYFVQETDGVGSEIEDFELNW